MSSRPYTRCHSCGTRYAAPRASAQCAECKDGQRYLWKLPHAPASFQPVAVSRSSVKRP